MAEGKDRGLLSIGIFLIILVVSILLHTPLELIPWYLIPPVILALSGIWTIVLAGIRASRPVKYERGPFSTFAWGLLLTAIGGAWFFFNVSWVYSLVTIVLVLGILAMAAAFRKK